MRKAWAKFFFIFVGFIGLSIQSPAKEAMSDDSVRQVWRDFRRQPREEQRKIHNIYSQFTKLKSEDKATAQSWIDRWMTLAPDERSLMKYKIQRWNQLSELQRNEIREKWAKESSEPKTRQ